MELTSKLGWLMTCYVQMNTDSHLRSDHVFFYMDDFCFIVPILWSSV